MAARLAFCARGDCDDYGGVSGDPPGVGRAAWARERRASNEAQPEKGLSHGALAEVFHFYSFDSGTEGLG